MKKAEQTMNKEQAIAKAAALEAAYDEANKAYWQAVDYDADDLTIDCRRKEMTEAWYAWGDALRETYW